MSIQQFRDKTDGMVAKIIVGLIILVFALFGMGSITTFLAPVPSVATVNGEDITQQEMEIAVERTRRILLAQQQTVDEDSLRNDVLQNLIQRELLQQRIAELDLHVSDAELDREIVNTEAFQQDGVFNGERFQMVLGGAGFTPMRYRDELRIDRMARQLNAAILQSGFAVPSQVARANSLAQQTRDIAYMVLPLDSVKSEVVVEEDEIEAYYENNRTQYFSPELFDVEYVELSRDALMEAVEVEESDLLSYYDEVKENYAVSEERRSAHILIEVNDDVSQDEAKAKVDEVYAAIIAGGDFAALASEHSNDPGSADNGGDLGFNGSGTFVPEFEAALFGLASPNQVSEPVLTQFGWHIIKLLEVAPEKVPEFAEIRGELEQAYRAREAEEQFLSLSTDLDEIAFESPDLVAPSEELGLPLKSTGLIGRDSAESILANPSVLAAVTGPDVLIDGNNSSLIELDASTHIVVRVKEHQPAAQLELAAVRDDITAQLLDQKAADLAVARAEAMVAELEDGAITRYIADQAGVEWEVVAEAQRFQAGIDADLVTKAFSLPKPGVDQKSVGYTELANGDVAVISVTNVQNRPAAQLPDIENEVLSQQLSFLQGQMDFADFQESMLETASISRVSGSE